jgi:hypothetical protein
MGVVYLGTARDGTRAAVKVLRPELADNQAFRVRFRREVAILARVQGLCTVRVIEADTESTRPFLATEYADGPTLAEYVSQHGPLGPDLLNGLAVGLTEALAAIHAAGVIHRDLKPGNVLLTPYGPKVIDFGIAQALDSTAITRTGMTVGSPGFMAPEQVLGEAGPPADVFCWGLTVSYAATGHLPFGTGPTDAVLYRLMHTTPDLSQLPTPLRRLVEAALARDPAGRPAARDLLLLVTSALNSPGDAGGAGTQALLARTWLLPAQDLPGAVGSAHRRRRYLLALLVATAVAVGAGGGAALLASRPHQAPPSATGTGRTAAPPSPALQASAQTPATRARPSLLATLIDPGGQGALSVAFGSDATLAVADNNGHTYLWNTTSRNLVATLTDPDNQAGIQVAFGPDGTLADVDNNGHPDLWNTTTRSLIATLAEGGSRGGAISVAFGPAQTLATGDASGKTYLWNTNNGSLIATLANPDCQFAISVAFGPDGTLAVADNAGHTWLWNTSTKNIIATFTEPGAYAQALAFRPDGTLAVASTNGRTWLWNTTTRSLITTLTDPGTQGASSAAFAPDGALAIEDDNGHTYVWNTATRSIIATLTDDNVAGSSAVAFGPDGTLALGGINGTDLRRI